MDDMLMEFLPEPNWTDHVTFDLYQALLLAKPHFWDDQDDVTASLDNTKCLSHDWRTGFLLLLLLLGDEGNLTTCKTQ
jgi:hypothetical protein